MNIKEEFKSENCKEEMWEVLPHKRGEAEVLCVQLFRALSLPVLGERSAG
jgi:hypothetical protein